MGEKQGNLMGPYVFALFIICFALIFTAILVKYMIYDKRTQEPDIDKIKDAIIDKIIPEIPEVK